MKQAIGGAALVVALGGIMGGVYLAQSSEPTVQLVTPASQVTTLPESTPTTSALRMTTVAPTAIPTVVATTTVAPEPVVTSAPVQSVAPKPVVKKESAVSEPSPTPTVEPAPVIAHTPPPNVPKILLPDPKDGPVPPPTAG